MADTGLQLRSLVTEEGTLEISLVDVEIPQPGPDEVLVRIEAAPINPSDLALLFGFADMSTARVGGTAERPTVTADIPEAHAQGCGCTGWRVFARGQRSGRCGHRCR